MTDIVAVEGPLEPERLEWVGRLYGQADPKYRQRRVLEHLFVAGAAGPALHAFAIDGGEPVGHCAVVPMPARSGAEQLRCGKVEALFVSPSHRGRQGGGSSIAVSMRERLYALADEHAIAPLHAYVLPHVRGILDLQAVRVAKPSLVSIMHATAFESRRGRVAATVLRSAQSVVRLPVTLSRLGRGADVRPATPADVDLIEASPPPPGQWTVLARDGWDWYRASPFVRVLAVGSARALVQLPGSPGDALRIVGFRADRPGMRPSLALLEAAVRLAQRTGAATVRFHPWRDDAALARACRLLGFVARDDFTLLSVRDAPTIRGDAVVPTPLLYLGF